MSLTRLVIRFSNCGSTVRFYGTYPDRHFRFLRPQRSQWNDFDEFTSEILLKWRAALKDSHCKSSLPSLSQQTSQRQIRHQSIKDSSRQQRRYRHLLHTLCTTTPPHQTLSHAPLSPTLYAEHQIKSHSALLRPSLKALD